MYFSLLIVSSALKVVLLFLFLPFSQISLFFYTQVINEGRYLVRTRLTYLSTEPLQSALAGMTVLNLLNAPSFYSPPIFKAASFAIGQ